MTLLKPTLLRWLPLAFLTTALCALVYLVIQQEGRQLADEPQGQIARDAAAALAGGRPVESVVPPVPIDLGQSLAPFVMVLDNAGAVVATSGRLRGQTRVVPAGVLEHVRQSGEERVTWQPEPGVRMATVVVRRADAGAGFVVSGRSLRETEERIERIQTIVGLAWILTLVGLLVLVGTGEYVVGRPAARSNSQS
jgi:hypothetical protein